MSDKEAVVSYSFLWLAARSIVFIITCYGVTHCVYSAFFHPLARFPGPPLAAVTNAPYCYWFLSGKQPLQVLKLHEKYGPIVRTAPNELSFNTSQSWKDIYDFRPGHQTFVKSTFYDGGSFADRTGSIVSERDPQRHGIMRRNIAHAFSSRSLSEQESLIASTVDKLVVKIGEAAGTGKELDIMLLFTLMSFDIIGDLGFGESFNGLGSEELHPWINRMTGAMMQGALADAFGRFPLAARLVLLFMGGTVKRLIRDTKINEQYSIDLVRRRVEKTTDRKDFYTRILENRIRDEMPDVELAAHASDFVLAGSETSSTCLSTIIFYLLKQPTIAAQLQHEIRSTFASYSEIDSSSTSTGLPFMQAVILEALRIFPPLPFALPRLVPNGGDTVDGQFLPQGVTVSTNPVAASLSASNFSQPLEFRPERWLDSNKSDDLKASQPFSLGPRGCIGRSLGWLEIRTTLAKLIYRFNFELVNPNLDWHADASMHTLWLKPSLLVRVTSASDK